MISIGIITSSVCLSVCLSVYACIMLCIMAGTEVGVRVVPLFLAGNFLLTSQDTFAVVCII